MRIPLAMAVVAVVGGWAGQAAAQAAAPSAGHREGSWELSLGGGYTAVDASLRAFLGSGAVEYRFANTPNPGGAGTAEVRLGYNFSRTVGFSLGAAVAGGFGVSYLSPSAAVTVTGNLNAKTSPFALVGTHFTRISGDHDRVTHSVWGGQLGLGVRHLIDPRLALRLEGRLHIEGYDEVPMSKSTVVNPLVLFGVSYFVGGRRGPGA